MPSGRPYSDAPVIPAMRSSPTTDAGGGGTGVGAPLIAGDNIISSSGAQRTVSRRANPLKPKGMGLRTLPVNFQSRIVADIRSGKQFPNMDLDDEDWAYSQIIGSDTKTTNTLTVGYLYVSPLCLTLPLFIEPRN